MRSGRRQSRYQDMLQDPLLSGLICLWQRAEVFWLVEKLVCKYEDAGSGIEVRERYQASGRLMCKILAIGCA